MMHLLPLVGLLTTIYSHFYYLNVKAMSTSVAFLNAYKRRIGKPEKYMWDNGITEEEEEGGDARLYIAVNWGQG